MSDPGGWLWALVGIGVIVLGLAIAYVNWVWRHRRMSRAERRAQDEATRDLFRRG
jgi:hypothetical protein